MLGAKHGRASARCAAFFGKAYGRSLEQKNAAGVPLSLACYPKPCSVACDKKEWDRFAEYARIWPAWKLSRHANRHNRFRMVSGPFLLHDQTNAAQGRTSGFDVCGLSNHDQLRVKRPRKVSAATATRLRISRRHRAISCLERRNVIAGIAFLVRSARYASIARESRCQTLFGVGAALAAPPSSWAGTTLMRGYLLFIPSAAAANMRFSAYEFETADSSDS